jgi:hypothetical protein
MKSKEQKRREAKNRQEKYDSLTNSQKIKQIMKRPGNSKKEFERIAKEIRENGGKS